MDLIGEALVKIKPDLTGLRFQVQAGVTEALRGLNTGELAAATGALAASNTALMATNLGLEGSAILASDAEGTLAVALRAAGIAADTTAASNVALASTHLALAGASRQAGDAAKGVGDKASDGSRGVRSMVDQSNFLRGTLIGISRVSPVAIFGLGVVGTTAIAASLGIRRAVELASDFERQLNVFQVVSQATADDMERVRQTAEALGRDLTLPGISAGDAAASLTELAKAGIEVQDAVDAARGVLQLGTAANIDYASAAQIAASALNAFDLPGTRAADVADLLAAASISAQGEITDMAAALNQSAAVAKNANISIEDTVTAISLLAKNGLLGSDAGTSLRTTILRLVPTTKEAAQFVKALGIEFEDSAGRLKPLPELFEEYQQALAALPPTLRQAALQQIFGQDAIRAASILAREGAEGFEEMAKEVTREGVAAEVAGAQTAGFSGDVAKLESNMEALGVTIGSLTLPALGLLITGLAEMAGALDDTINRFEEAGGNLFDFVSEVASIGPFDEFFRGEEAANEVERLTNEIVELNDLMDRTFSATFLPGFAQQAEELGTDLREMGVTAADLGAAFRDQEGPIADALDGGIIRPLEVAALQATETGRAFLAGFAGTEGRLRDQLDAIEALTDALGRVPTEKEVAILLTSEDFAAGIAEVTANALQAGTLAGEAVNTGFDAGVQSRPTAPGAHLIDGITANTDDFRKGGETIGKAVVDGMADAITAQERKAINAARDAVQDAIEAAEEQTTAAVFQARDNLTSLGDDLNRDLETLIDTGPIAQRIEELQARLDRLTAQDEAADLRERQRLARQNLREARESLLTGIGELSPQARREQQEFLKPFQDGVRDANAALKEFDLSSSIESLEDAQEAAKEAAQRGLNDLIQKFKDGQISAGQFSKLLDDQLRPALNTLKTEAGQNLGLSFSSGFLQNVQNLKDQVQALVGFLGITGPSPDVVRPGEVAAEGAENVAEARRNLRETIENARKTEENTADSSATLKRIERLILTAAARAPSSPGGTKITANELANIRAVTSGERE